MSGGAAGEVIFPVVDFVSKFRVGRILLLTVASLFALLALPADADLRALFLCIALLIGAIPLGYAIQDYWRNRPFFSKWFLFKLAVGVVLAGGALLVLWLVSRRREQGVAPPPPLPEDVDRLAQLETAGERVA